MLRALAAASVLATGCWALGEYHVTFPTLPGGHQPVTVVHTSDLHYPGWDMDDVFDAVTWYALAAGGYADVEGIVCDQPFSHSRGDGRAWQGILNIATGLDIPHYDGLTNGLASESDNGDGQGTWTAGRDRILQVMSTAADHSVVLTGVGSLRDVAAAYNKNSTLFMQKIKAVYTSGGGQGGDTWDANWGSDRNAVRRLLNRGVPMYVAFCGASGEANNGSDFLLDFPGIMATADAVNPKMSQALYWSYWGSQEGGFRYKHYRLDTERYAYFGLPKLDPSPWAGLNRPAMPPDITVSEVMADPQALFDEPMDEYYARDGFHLTLSDELRDPPVGSDGSTQPFGIKGMWSTPLFLEAVGLKIYRSDSNPGEIRVDFSDPGGGWQQVLAFDPATYTFTSDQFHYTASTEPLATTHIFHWHTPTQGDYQEIIDAVNTALLGRYLPEPSAAVLLALGALALRRRR